MHAILLVRSNNLEHRSCSLFAVLSDGSGRAYPANLISNDNASVPVAFPPPPTSPAAARDLVRQSSNLAIDEQNFPRLPSPPQGVFD